MGTKAISIGLVILATALTSTGQVLFKVAAEIFNFSLAGTIGNAALITGFLAYGLAALLVVLSLKKGELSVIYPIIATGFIWVSVLSTFVFHETMNEFKWAGILFIMFGVSLIGWGSQ